MTTNVLSIVIYGVVFFIFLTVWTLFSKSDFFSQSVKNFYFSFYTFVELLFFSLIYYLNIKNRLFKRVIATVFSVFALFQVAYFFNVEIKSLDNIPIGIETVIVFVYIFYFFYEYFVTINYEYVYDNYCFWVSIGIMIYLGSSFFVYILSDHISEGDHEKFFSLSYIIETIKNILFSIAIVVDTRQKSKQKIPNQNIPYLDFN